MKHGRRSRGLLPLVAVGAIVATLLAAPGEPEEYTSYTKVGDRVPSFTVKTLAGEEFDIEAMKGKVVLLNFWATWCPPCHTEMPVLERKVWGKYRSDNFAMIAIAREQTAKEINAYRQKNKLSFPMAADPDRKIFARFAQAGIPRNYVINSEGIIVYQSYGYTPEEFAKMTAILQRELRKQSAGAPLPFTG